MSLARIIDPPVAMATPSPPMIDSTSASMRDCRSTSRSSAQMARRMPILRGQLCDGHQHDVHDADTTTSRLTSATAPSSMVRIFGEMVTVLAI